jgi:ParB family chromosome partitioning protein
MSIKKLPTKFLSIRNIVVKRRMRAVDEEVVERLMRSIKVDGLINPITVRRRNGEVRLVSGAHRLEAFRRLGESKITCRVIPAKHGPARSIQISENLHRKDLTALEFAEHFVEWEKLNPGIAFGKKRSASAHAKLRKRCEKIAALSDLVKAALREAKLDDNQRAMLKVAAEPNEKAQLATIAATKSGSKQTRRKQVRPRHDLDGMKEYWDRAKALQECWEALSKRDRRMFVEDVLGVRVKRGSRVNN